MSRCHLRQQKSANWHWSVWTVLAPKVAAYWYAEQHSGTLNEAKGALADARRATELDPCEDVLWSNRAVFAAHFDEFDEADGAFATALRLSPSLSTASSERPPAPSRVTCLSLRRPKQPLHRPNQNRRALHLSTRSVTVPLLCFASAAPLHNCQQTRAVVGCSGGKERGQRSCFDGG
jgi:hypothetical protein